MLNNWRLYVLILVMIASTFDVCLTYYYINKYKTWQPDKPYNLMERNPLLVFLWNKLGLVFGTLSGLVIILTLEAIIIKEAHWVIVLILLGLLVFAFSNHYSNINLLNKLIEKYPSGYLPVETFGEVVGNNLK